MKASQCRFCRFGVFEFNPQANQLRKRGLKVKLRPLACRVLALLLEHPGQVQTRREMSQRLWPAETFLDFDHSLNKAIHALRASLGDSATSPRYIETVAGQGYRFIPILELPSQPSQCIDCSEQVAREILQHLRPILSTSRRKVASTVSKELRRPVEESAGALPARFPSHKVAVARGHLSIQDGRLLCRTLVVSSIL